MDTQLKQDRTEDEREAARRISRNMQSLRRNGMTPEMVAASALFQVRIASRTLDLRYGQQQ
jgi:hypothetical protein